MAKSKTQANVSVAEEDLRQQMVARAMSWVGTEEGSEGHQKILGEYNSQKSLPRNYKLQSGDDWCAGFVSAVAGECGNISKGLVPSEVSVNKMTQAFIDAGNYQTADSGYEPKAGDVVFYDWQEGSEGTDPVSSADHVGIVKSNEDGVLTVIEGNTDQDKDGTDEVATREVTLGVDDGSIRGYGTPDYANKAEELSQQEKVKELGKSAKDSEQKDAKSLGGTSKLGKSLAGVDDEKDATEASSESESGQKSEKSEKKSKRREPSAELLGTSNAASSDFSLIDTLGGRSRYM